MRLFSILMIFWFASGAIAAEDLPYTPIEPPVQVTTESPEQVEVVELFWYSCPHCFHFDPVIKAWMKTKADYIQFRRMPAVYKNNPRGTILAKAFFTAELLGVLDQVHSPLFRAYHVDKQRFERSSEVRDIFMKYGVSQKDFDDTFDSFAVDMKMRQASTLTEQYGVREVPTLVLAGKYRLESGKVGGYKELMNLVDTLAAQEHDALLKAAHAQTEESPTTLP